MNDSYLFVLGFYSQSMPFLLQDKKPKFKNLEKGGKFITSDQYIEKVRNRLDVKNINIVYEDSLLKLLETNLEEFAVSDVPVHKITQIKYFNDVVWDRKRRFSKIPK